VSTTVYITKYVYRLSIQNVLLIYGFN
jgi:hypothetical protein